MNVGSLPNMNPIVVTGQMNIPSIRYPTYLAAPSAPAAIPYQNTSNLFFSMDGDRVEISDSARMLEALEPQGMCITCENRKYVDQSNDASVSFQTPTSINPNMAAAAVAAHENEHVRNEQARAHREDREIVSQTVTLTYDCCPECGRHYVSGGTTKTTSINKSDDNESANDGQTTKSDA